VPRPTPAGKDTLERDRSSKRLCDPGAARRVTADTSERGSRFALTLISTEQMLETAIPMMAKEYAIWGAHMLSKIATGIAAAALAGGICMAGTAGAAGGKGASVCSGSSAPDGVVDPIDPATWNSAGEIISYVAPDLFRPGQQVKATCNPTQG